MSEIMVTVVQCVLLIPTIATIGAFWFLVFSAIIDGTFVKAPSDKEIEEKTK